MRRLPTRRLGVVVASALLLSACGAAGQQAPSSDETGAAGSEAPPAVTEMVLPEDRLLADDQNLVVRQYSEPVGFDPATLFRIDTEMIALNIYNGLTSFDPVTGQPTPGLAESWDISEDGLTYTFHLVENATWHFDYGPFTAADVVYSYERILDPATGSQYRAELGSIEEIVALDDYTVEITLNAPDANFLLQVTNNHQGQIVNQQAIEDFGDDYPRHPVGTGPFYLESWTPNATLVLQRHEDYFLGAADLESVTFELITDAAAAETALLNGEVDAAAGMNNLSAEQYDRVASTDGFWISVAEGYTTNAWLFGSDFEPFQDQRVRQAFVMALDNAAILEAIAPHSAQPWQGILPPWMAETDTSIEPIAFDPDGAKALLAEAGYPDGFTVRLISTAPTETAILQQDFLAQVGITLEFDIVEVPVFNERRQSGDFELSFRVYPAINPDTLLRGYLHPENAAPTGMNGSKYDNPEVTALLDEARSELDQEARFALYAQIQQIVADEVMYPASAATNLSWAMSAQVRNVQVNQLAGVDLYPVYISAE